MFTNLIHKKKSFYWEKEKPKVGVSLVFIVKTTKSLSTFNKPTPDTKALCKIPHAFFFDPPLTLI